MEANMKLNKIAVFSSVALLSMGLAGCSSSTTPKPKNISYSQLSSYKSRKKVVNKDLAKKLKKDQKKAKDGDDDYNYSLYLYKVQTWEDQTIAVNVDKDNYINLSTKEKVAVGQSIDALVKKTLKENHVKGKNIFITIYDEDGNVLVPAYNYVTLKFKNKKDQEEANVPVEYQNALDKAQSYSDNMHMSKQGLYEQLTSEVEGFSKKSASYAIKHVQANWNKNALEKAKSYQKNEKMSRNAIYDQLTSSVEGFTPSQARYAINHLPK